MIERRIATVQATVVFEDGETVQVFVAEGTDAAWGSTPPYLADTLDLREAIRDAVGDQWAIEG